MCLTGMPGAGKTIVSEIAKKMGIPTISMGDIIREEAEIRSIEPTSNNLGWLMMELREKMGANIVALRCIEKIERIKSDKILIEGVRNIEEIKEFKNIGKVTIIAVHASPKTRFKRLIDRGRKDDPKTWEEFEKRDFRELEVGIGKVIALADKVIINEGTLEELERITFKTLEEVVKAHENNN
ncbi:MAG: AAA family ATPase [Candidatus Methanomethylicia archaeon]